MWHTYTHYTVVLSLFVFFVKFKTFIEFKGLITHHRKITTLNELGILENLQTQKQGKSQNDDLQCLYAYSLLNELLFFKLFI